MSGTAEGGGRSSDLHRGSISYIPIKQQQPAEPLLSTSCSDAGGRGPEMCCCLCCCGSMLWARYTRSIQTPHTVRAVTTNTSCPWRGCLQQLLSREGCSPSLGTQPSSPVLVENLSVFQSPDTTQSEVKLWHQQVQTPTLSTNSCAINTWWSEVSSNFQLWKSAPFSLNWGFLNPENFWTAPGITSQLHRALNDKQ